MKQVLLVFLGGGGGSVLRYLLSKAFNPENSFPFGTWMVNILGSLLIGLFLGWSLKQHVLSGNTSLLLITGFCGGFTTFSAFAYENQVFLKAGDYLNFGIYTLSSLCLGIGAVLIGLLLSRLI